MFSFSKGFPHLDVGARRALRVAWRVAVDVVTSYAMVGSNPSALHLTRQSSIMSPLRFSMFSIFNLKPPLCVYPATLAVRSKFSGEVLDMSAFTSPFAAGATLLREVREADRRLRNRPVFWFSLIETI